jgi:hypothetical protein
MLPKPEHQPATLPCFAYSPCDTFLIVSSKLENAVSCCNFGRIS